MLKQVVWLTFKQLTQRVNCADSNFLEFSFHQSACDCRRYIQSLLQSVCGFDVFRFCKLSDFYFQHSRKNYTHSSITQSGITEMSKIFDSNACKMLILDGQDSCSIFILFSWESPSFVLIAHKDGLSLLCIGFLKFWAWFLRASKGKYELDRKRLNSGLLRLKETGISWAYKACFYTAL